MTKPLQVINDVHEATQAPALRSSVSEDTPGSRSKLPATKSLVRRISPDHSQAWRRLLQILFLALNACIGLQFVLFVHYRHSGALEIADRRPPEIVRDLPGETGLSDRAVPRSAVFPYRIAVRMEYPGNDFPRLLLKGIGLSALGYEKSFGWMGVTGRPHLSALLQRSFVSTRQLIHNIVYIILNR